MSPCTSTDLVAADTASACSWAIIDCSYQNHLRRGWSGDVVGADACAGSSLRLAESLLSRYFDWSEWDHSGLLLAQKQSLASPLPETPPLGPHSESEL